MEKRKIVIIGAGAVGATFAYATMINGIAEEIVLIDRNETKAAGEVADLNHGLPFVAPVTIKQGDYSECKDAGIIVVTAGVAQKPGESRLQLVQRNVDIFQNIIPEIEKYNSDSIILIVTNPVDILTYISKKLSKNKNTNNIIGSGTVLDTSRFKYFISNHCNVDAHNVHGYIIGEHGDSELAIWSQTNIGGINFDRYCNMCNSCNMKSQVKENVIANVKNSAYHIIEGKGATYYAVSQAMLRIVKAIFRNENSILTVSTDVNDYYGINDVCLSLPCIVNKHGIRKVLNTPLNEDEINGLKKSACILKDIINNITFFPGNR